MEFSLLDQLLPNTSNPDFIQERINAFLISNPDIDENAFNEILAGMELLGFKKGFKVSLQLIKEIYDQSSRNTKSRIKHTSSKLETSMFFRVNASYLSRCRLDISMSL